MRKTVLPFMAAILVGMCHHGAPPEEPHARLQPDQPGRARLTTPAGPGWVAQRAPRPSKRLSGTPSAKKLTKRIQSYFAGRVGRRIHIQLDKPLYKPGETIWIKTWNLQSRDLGKPLGSYGLNYQLVSPRGSVVMRKRVREENGMATNDFQLPASIAGGEYKLRVYTFDGKHAERPVVISSYEAPRIKKKLEFLRKAYGAGDEVTATIEVKRPTGEALADKALSGIISVDGRSLPQVSVTTNAEGGAVIRFKLPKRIVLGDGMLTVMVADGGITESVSKRIPILLNKVQFAMFPEGGALVSGLKSRVYFSAKNMIGKPADVEGQVFDDHGNLVALFRSHFHGMGRFTVRPATGRSYHAVITRPVGITEKFSLPFAKPKGCVLNSYDDPDSERSAIVVRVACTKTQKVIVSAMIRENLIDAATVRARQGHAAIVHLRSHTKKLNRAQGVARVTLFDTSLTPLAERLVYRNRKNSLRVKVRTSQKAYQPRNKVALKVRTTDSYGHAVQAELALSVVDDTVVSFADDKTGNMLSRLYLEPELPGEVHEPNKYFDNKNRKAARALDLLVGTRGWRKFAWRQVLTPPPKYRYHPTGSGRPGLGGMRGRRHLVVVQKNQIILRPEAAPPRPGRMAARRPAPVKAAQPAPIVAKDKREPRADRPAQPRLQRIRGNRQARARFWRGPMAAPMARDEERRPWRQWALVRVFPAPTYKGDYDGPRTDFRETIHWAPRLKTDKNGNAEASFYLSDAVTSFRIFTEGVGGGLAGRSETVLKSSLPFSMHVKLPVEVSAGDQLNLPLTLTNETKKPLNVAIHATFGKLLRADRSATLRTIRLAAGQRQSLFYPVRVTGNRGQSKVTFLAKAGSLKDEFTRAVTVVPLGFPQEISASGEVLQKKLHSLDLGQVIPGSVMASVRLYPSPVASMTQGMEGMLRQPSGCFEQASSSNYPNVMVMSYLKEHRINDVKLLQRSAQLLEAGYRKLTGYESKSRGYEWFGSNPGHEALTAYGLLEFVDMKRVFPNVSRPMIARTARWLRDRRDGNGGYLRNARALDSFGRASKQVTDAYITYSLTEAGERDLAKELRVQLGLSKSAKDAYLLALAANSLLNTPQYRAAGERAARRLAAMQADSGAWTNASHSITRSGGNNLLIETTALAMTALIKAGDHSGKVRKAMGWLNKNRGGWGQWGSTQATILGLRAMLAYAKANRKTKHPGAVSIKLGGRTVGKFSYKAGHRDPILFANLGDRFARGANR
ncbi:MAG: MG2 domain-containing protein, partial [bacterium]